MDHETAEVVEVEAYLHGVAVQREMEAEDDAVCLAAGIHDVVHAPSALATRVARPAQHQPSMGRGVLARWVYVAVVAALASMIAGSPMLESHDQIRFVVRMDVLAEAVDLLHERNEDPMVAARRADCFQTLLWSVPDMVEAALVDHGSARVVAIDMLGVVAGAQTMAVVVAGRGADCEAVLMLEDTDNEAAVLVQEDRMLSANECLTASC